MEWKQWEGSVIDGRFLLRQLVGACAHSGLFLTEFGSEPQTAVIKLIPADLGKAQTWMLRRELAAKLSHPGLLSILAFGTAQHEGGSLAYVVMERSDEDLSQVVPVRPLDAAEAREMLTAVLDALAYIHAEGFVHGCLTPANIVAVGDRVKITSDALMRIGESSDDLWAPNPCGAPESRAGITPAGDVWSLGMTLVEVLTQHAPAWTAGGSADPAVAESLPAPFLNIARRCLRSEARLRCSLADIASVLNPPRPPLPEPVKVAEAARPPAPVAETVPAALLRAAAPAKAAMPWTRQYLLPAVAGTVLGGLILTGAILTRGSDSASHAATPPKPALAEKPIPYLKPSPAPLTPPSRKAAAVTDSAVPVTHTVPAVAEATPAINATAPGGDIVDRVVPEVPPEILGTVRGVLRVTVRVYLDSSGSVDDEELESARGSKYFDRVALEAAHRWKFKPAGTSGRDTRLVHFEFRSSGCQASAGRP